MPSYYFFPILVLCFYFIWDFTLKQTEQWKLSSHFIPYLVISNFFPSGNLLYFWFVFIYLLGERINLRERERANELLLCWLNPFMAAVLGLGPAKATIYVIKLVTRGSRFWYNAVVNSLQTKEKRLFSALSQSTRNQLAEGLPSPNSSLATCAPTVCPTLWCSNYLEGGLWNLSLLQMPVSTCSLPGHHFHWSWL